MDGLRKILGLVGHEAQQAGHGVQGAFKEAMNSPVGQAINSVNPLFPQPAISAESLRPDQSAQGYSAPYNINGQQGSVGWRPNFPYMNFDGPKMPQVEGIPDYLEQYQDFNADMANTPIDGSFLQNNPNSFQPKANLIPNAQVPQETLKHWAI